VSEATRLRHVLEAQQFNKKLIGQVFRLAEEMEAVVRAGGSEDLRGKIMITLFYSISTRTRLSFESAMLRLGGSVMSTEHPEAFSADAAGGSLDDTIRMAESFCDVVVLRHPAEGSAHRAAEVSSIPVINAGDGGGQHPTQALLDLYTIYRAIGGIEGVSVVIMGDLATSRTIRSLCYFLAKYSGVKLWLVSPKDFTMRRDITEYLDRHGVAYKELSEPGAELAAVLQRADVVYQTDLPRQHGRDPGILDPSHLAFRIDARLLAAIPKRAIIMHPFPRVDGISPEVDSDRRAFYFHQIQNGLYIRMALLRMLLRPQDA